jgi:DUF971 family protein
LYKLQGGYFSLNTSRNGQLSYISGSSQVEVEFADGSSFHLSAEFLRVYSPAADSKIRSIAGEKVAFFTLFYVFLVTI